MSKKLYPKNATIISRRSLRLLIAVLYCGIITLCAGCCTPPTLQELSERHPEAVKEAKERLLETGGVR